MSKGLHATRLTADGAASTTPGWLRKITVTRGNSVGYIYVYDGTGVTGTLKYQATFPAAAAATGESSEVDFPGKGVYCATAIYVDISGGTTAAFVYWDM